MDYEEQHTQLTDDMANLDMLDCDCPELHTEYHNLLKCFEELGGHTTITVAALLDKMKEKGKPTRFLEKSANQQHGKNVDLTICFNHDLTSANVAQSVARFTTQPVGTGFESGRRFLYSNFRQKVP